MNNSAETQSGNIWFAIKCTQDGGWKEFILEIVMRNFDEKEQQPTLDQTVWRG